ncbi:MAG: response regulator [Symploca sp. SIO2G7]|nr:response regulator [Symploca sp. SIO2G7]
MNIDNDDQAYEFFVQEALELLQRLEEGLLSLQKDHAVQKIHGLMRAAHSIKGGAACIGLNGIETIAHDLENGIRALYQEETVFDLELEELLLKAFDSLRLPIIEQIETGKYDAQAAIEKAKPVFEQLEEKLGHPLAESAELPEVEMEGDITQFIFTEEVTQGLHRWESLLANPQAPEVIEDIKTQVEVFASLGEMLNLPDFVAIANTTLKALQVNPQALVTISKLALADFREIQKAVLSDKHQQLINPNEALVKLTQKQDYSTLTAPAADSRPSETPDRDSYDAKTQRHGDAESAHPANFAWWSSSQHTTVPSELAQTNNVSTTTEDSAQPVDQLSGFQWLGNLIKGWFQPQSPPENFPFPSLSVEEPIKTTPSIEDKSTPVKSDKSSLTIPTSSPTQEEINQKGERKKEWGNESADAENGNSTSYFVHSNQKEATEIVPPLVDKSTPVESNESSLTMPTSVQPTSSSPTQEEISQKELTEIVPPLTDKSTPTESDNPSVTIQPISNHQQPAPTSSPTTEQVNQQEPNEADTSTADSSKMPLGVRVDINRLDIINNLVGELVTQDNSFLLQNQHNKATLESLKRWFNRFNKLANKLQVINNDDSESQTAKLEDSGFFYEQNSPSPGQTVVEEIAQLGEVIQDMELLYRQNQQILKKRQQTVKQIQNNLLQARMLNVGELLNRFPRTIRDLSAKQNKQVKLDLIGKNTLIEKAILEKLYDPLVHLVRNAFDHGIEAPELRQLSGKSPQGTITIRAYKRGNYTYIEVQDDGQGIDLEKIRFTAIEKKLIDSSQAAKMSKNQLYNLLFTPGFSLSPHINELSGRGMGLEAMLLQVEALKGSVSVTSELGQGTTFTLRLPWTLTITKLLVFRVKGNLLAIPVDTITTILSVTANEIKVRDQAPRQQVYYWQGKTVPIVQSLFSAYHYPSRSLTSTALTVNLPLNYRQRTVTTRKHPKTQQPSGKIMLLLVSQGSDTIALKIDHMLMEQDLVIKPFDKALTAPSYFYGCTILGDGRLVPVIDGLALVERVVNADVNKAVQSPTAQVMPAHPLAASTPSPNKQRESIRKAKVKPTPKPTLPTILVIDDSLTTRQTICSTLQKAGYPVVQAKNGVDALAQLQQHPQIQGIICDVEMPQMNGFEFLRSCRKQFTKDELPILMLTSRTSERYRQLAKQLGANSYLTKPYLAQELITTLRNCLKLN